MSSVVLKCLQKDPSDRYQTCAEIIPVFESALAGKGEEGQGDFLKYAIAGVTAIIVIAAAVFFLKPTPDTELIKIKSTKWADVAYDYIFPDCRGYAPCSDKKDQADKLAKISNWKDVQYNDPILKDCMKLDACLSRQTHAAALTAIADWKHVTDLKLLNDCMSLMPCQQRYQELAIPPIGGEVSILKKSCAYVADNVDCCTLSNEAERNYCMQCKKKERVTGGDCGGVYRLPK
jgi:hypothetical protein